MVALSAVLKVDQRVVHSVDLWVGLWAYLMAARWAVWKVEKSVCLQVAL